MSFGALLRVATLCLVLAPVSVTASGSSTLERVFSGLLGDGTGTDLAVSGNVEMKTETNFSFSVTVDLTRGSGNTAYGITSTLKISDQRCDFRNIQVETRVAATLPRVLDSATSSLCRLTGLLCDVSSSVEIGSFKSSYDLIPDGTNVVQSELSIDIVEQIRRGTPTVANSLDLLGADAVLTMKNIDLMVTGMKFDLFFKADMLDSDADICTNTGLAYSTFRDVARNFDSQFCTPAGGIRIGHSGSDAAGINLGSELKYWISSSGQNTDYIDSDGTIIVGLSDGAACTSLPADFSLNGRASDLGNIPTNSDQLREALANAANQYLPNGYRIGKEQFSNLNITVDPQTGDLTISGKVYSGAAKSPAGILDALRRFIADGGSLNAGTSTGSSTVIIDSGDLSGDASCQSNSGLRDAGACSSEQAPPESSVQGEPDQDDGSSGNNKGSGNGGGNMQMVIVGTIFITLASVAAVVGAVMLVKLVRKRRATVRHFGRGQDHIQLQDGFDNIVQGSHGDQKLDNDKVVWGDVVSVDKP